MVGEMIIPSWSELTCPPESVPEGYRDIYQIIDEVEKDTGQKFSRQRMREKLSKLEKEGKLDTMIFGSSQRKYYKRRAQDESHPEIRPNK